jgi:hypothetical protein
VPRFPIFLLVSLLTLILGSISACTSRPTPTAAPLISRDKAIEIAAGGCKIPDLVLVGEPKNIRTQLLKSQEANMDTSVAGYLTGDDLPPDTLVWIVQMDGNLLLVGGPVPIYTQDSQGLVATPTPPQPFWGSCTAAVDANSGKLLVIRNP